MAGTAWRDDGDVEHVVDQVVGRGHEAETEKGDDDRADGAWAQLVRHQKGKEEKNVFGPLMDANGFEQGARQGTLVVKRAGDGDVPQTQRNAQPEAGIGHHRHACAGQQGKVGARVADVVELSEPVLEPGQLLAAGQVGEAVRGQDAGKDAQMRGYPLGQSAIGSGGQVDFSSRAAFSLQVAEQFGVEGQPGGIERCGAGHLGLQAGAASSEPQRQLPEPGRISAQELANSIEESVGLDQRAV